MKVHDKLFIGGEWTTPATNAVIEVISPHTEKVIARVPAASAADVDKAVAVARTAFDNGEWPQLPPDERIAAVERFTNLYFARLGEMAEIITEEMGSPLSFSNLGQAPASWMVLNKFLGIAKAFPWEETRVGMLGTDVLVRHEDSPDGWPRLPEGTRGASTGGPSPNGREPASR